MDELDDIERVLDHATWELQPWEPKREELDAIYEIGGMTKDYELAIGRLFVKKYQEWLAKQVGEKPCEGCDALVEYHFSTTYHLEDCQRYCQVYQVYLGQQSGYAKGIQESQRNLAQRIVYLLDQKGMPRAVEFLIGTLKQEGLLGAESPVGIQEGRKHE